MRLSEIRTRIERALQHAPAVETHRAELNDRINDAEQALMQGGPWPFRQRHMLLRCKADVVLPPGSYTYNTAIAGVYGFEFTPPASWDNFDRFFGVLGALVTITGGVSTAINTRFVVERALQGAGTNIALRLDPRFSGSILTGAETFTIQHLRYGLPRHTTDVLSLMDRDTDRGPMREISLAREAGMLLDATDLGAPEVYMLDPNHQTSWDRWSGNAYPHDYNEPPHSAPTAVGAVVGVSTLPLLQRFSYRYAWRYAGLWSPASPQVDVTLTGTQNHINLAGLETLFSAALGRTRQLFRRQNEGPWFALSEITDPTVATFADTGAFLSASPNPVVVTRERHYHTPGGQVFIRLWPRPDADRVLELRYVSAVPLLEDDSDEPEFPQHHEILVHAVARDLAMQADANRLASYHAGRYEEMLRLMRRTMGGNTGQRNVRGSVLGGEGASHIRVGRPVMNG